MIFTYREKHEAICGVIWDQDIYVEYNIILYISQLKITNFYLCRETYQKDMAIGLGVIQQILAKLAARTMRKSGGGHRGEHKLGRTYYGLFPVTRGKLKKKKS